MTGGRNRENVHNPHARQGVADYFAILGVGKDLIWKHAQQKEEGDQRAQQEQDNEQSHTTLSPRPLEKNAIATIPEEDDALLLERFYREIVECDIVLEDDDESSYDDNAETCTSITNTTVLSTATAEGWTVVRNTRPAATNSNPLITPGDGKGPQLPLIPSLWEKGKTWDSNLDPIDGLTSEILRSKHQRDAAYQIELERIQSGRRLNGHDTKTPLKDLKKRVQSTFQSKTQQWLQHPLNRSFSYSNNFENNLHPKRRRKFYLTYKRRSPDQPNVPAIADLALYYIRIHKSTVVSEENSDRVNKTPLSPTKSFRDIASVNTSASKTQVVAAAASAVGRSGIRASAALLNAGRQAVSHHWNPLIYENSQFASPQTNRQMTSPTQNSGNEDPAQRHRDDRGPLIALESFIDFPPSEGNFDEWVIPEAFSCLRFPLRQYHKASSNACNDDHEERSDSYHYEYRRPIQTTTVLFPETNEVSSTSSSTGGNQGVEAVDRTPDRVRMNKVASIVAPTSSKLRYNSNESDEWKERFIPRVVDPSDKDFLAFISGEDQEVDDEERYHPKQGESVIVSSGSGSFDNHSDYKNFYGNEYIYVPVLALRRQRIGEEERFTEDPALIDVSVSIFDERGQAVMPSEEYQFMTEEEMMEDENEVDEKVEMKVIHKTKWTESRMREGSFERNSSNHSNVLQQNRRQDRRERDATARAGSLCLIVRHNVPIGFCDAAFSTSVLDRFPHKNYKGLPLPEEELPMFCYPTGCRLFRAKYSDAPLPQYYGFVVKNERGDSIYVSCVSFMEPLTNKKKEQLSKLSEKRRRVSLPHKIHWARKQQQVLRKKGRGQNDTIEDQTSALSVASPSDWIAVEERDAYYEEEMDSVLTAFDQMTTYENKTICIVSRYPYWTAFRKFLSHLHSVSGCSSDLPLERYISHLLLTVPVPKPGGPSILMPLPTFNIPMMFSSPPQKDLPLVDLPFDRLLACLDVPTIVTMVIGFLALERKVIVMSTRPSLVLDVCECARALLFPFELVAPYVPRLTEPFMSCLEFPGAIFAGIHDDGTPNGLAALVREQMPEDSTIINLDKGTVDCSGDRTSTLNNSWGCIPPGPRSVLVSEIETLCRDASIVPGQEPLDGILDSAFEVSAPSSMVEDHLTMRNEDREPLDDRGIRDAFLRFFCSILVGYERFLVVPDVDFLISGNEWFDAKGFLDAASEDNAVFLGSLVSTQLFQSFIQRRTEASDVHLLLFDECLQEYHSSSIPYGRLGGDVETVTNKDTGKSELLYSLLVDQAAEESRSTISAVRSFDGESKAQSSETDNSSGQNISKGTVSDITDRLARYSEFGINGSGDWVTLPSYRDVPKNTCYTYCIDGNPTFPDKLNQCFYVPRQPESWLVEMSTTSTPMLTRSGPEKEEAERRRRFSTSYRGLHSQRKCLWQLPKLMGSHFLGTWLLCIPTLVSQPDISYERQSTYLLRAFGALRLLRARQKIVPDEAAYRALIVACGRTKNDRRAELVKLFGHLRSDGIFPSAVTLGQYTRALAEGYSKRAVGTADDERSRVERAESTVGDLDQSVRKQWESILNLLDGSLAALEESGSRWRQKTNTEKNNESVIEDTRSKTNERQKNRNTNKSWLPVLLSSSFVETNTEACESGSKSSASDIQLTAIWSRTVACKECHYIPFEEEVQGGWDAIHGGDHDFQGAVSCPRCGFLISPKLAYKDMTLQEAIQIPQETKGLPPQIRETIEDTDPNINYVGYICPSALRDQMERVVDEHGEQVLEREKLRKNFPDLFYNLWWFCARFQLPLPLSVSSNSDASHRHCCAIISWDQQVAMRGCYSCAKIMLDTLPCEENPAKRSEESMESLDDFPLLSKFNLAGFYSNVWDHPDLSEILVALVQACDKRDFRPVVESILRRDKNIDCYRTIIYLAKYQCTSAFHAFFPATIKPCKGYHFWCPMVPLPIFDRLFREAVKRVRASSVGIAPIHEVGEVSLAFRSVFGHLL